MKSRTRAFLQAVTTPRNLVRLAAVAGGAAAMALRTKRLNGELASAAASAPSAPQPRSQLITASAFAPEGTRTRWPETTTSRTPVTAAPAPFTYLMLRWRASGDEAGGLSFRVRVSEDGQEWTSWEKVQRNEDLLDPDDPADVRWSNAVYTGPALYWQLRVTSRPRPDGALAVLHEVQASTVDTRGSDVIGTRQIAQVAASTISRPAYVSRGAWGGIQVLNNSVAPTWYPANHLVVHHTADSNVRRPNETTWADRVRAEWSFHTYSRGWGDIGYNWLIDPNGVIYEGRNGSSDPTRDSVGFHDTANRGSMGVALLGTFQSTIPGAIAPTAAAQNALVRLLAWKAAQRGIDPLGRSFYYGCSVSTYCAPYNPGSVLPNIAGHRQVTPRTTCPGDLTMAQLDTIRSRVRDALAVSPAPVVRAELTSVQALESHIEGGGIVQVRITVRNTGTVAIATQEPEPGRIDDIAPGHVYDEAECFLGDVGGSYPAFPKEAGRFRVILGGTEGGAALGAQCNGDTGGYPWRWGLGASLQPGETRTVVGYVRFRNPTSATRTITLRANLINEYVEYFPPTISSITITVGPERRIPAVPDTDERGLPLASVYRLVPVPESLLARSAEPASIREGDFIDTVAWDGSEQRWAVGGPAGQPDRFVIRQARPFVAPTSGVYTFELTSDDGSWLWIDDRLVVTNHGLHPAESVSSSIWLAAGTHMLEVKYFEYSGLAYARYSWMPPGATSFSTIPVIRP